MATKKRSEKKSFAPMSIAVSGFKSLRDEQKLDIKPLTILSGANSSGKSSIMQPLLLMKQTLEAPYDPGIFLLHGENVKFTSYRQFTATQKKGQKIPDFITSISTGKEKLKLKYNITAKSGLKINSTESETYDIFGEYREPLSVKIDHSMGDKELSKLIRSQSSEKQEFYVARNRFYLEIGSDGDYFFPIYNLYSIKRLITKVIHVPGLRGNPERTYNVSGVSNTFSGSFVNYVASILLNWYQKKDKSLSRSLNTQLEALGLTWKISPQPIDDTQVEIRVGRLPKPARGGARDLVSIADVGFGVSQTLPVLIALLAAEKDQIVYIEQPEIHLHPNAQYKLAQFFVEAANRGIRVVVETHSSIFIRGVQTHIAKGDIDPERVGLNWFNRSPKTGATTITTAELGEDGSYGDWPEDFDDTYLSADREYLDAAALKDFEQ